MGVYHSLGNSYAQVYKGLNSQGTKAKGGKVPTRAVAGTNQFQPRSESEIDLITMRDIAKDMGLPKGFYPVTPSKTHGIANGSRS